MQCRDLDFEGFKTALREPDVPHRYDITSAGSTHVEDHRKGPQSVLLGIY